MRDPNRRQPSCVGLTPRPAPRLARAGPEAPLNGDRARLDTGRADGRWTYVEKLPDTIFQGTSACRPIGAARPSWPAVGHCARRCPPGPPGPRDRGGPHVPPDRRGHHPLPGMPCRAPARRRPPSRRGAPCPGVGHLMSPPPRARNSAFRAPRTGRRGTAVCPPSLRPPADYGRLSPVPLRPASRRPGSAPRPGPQTPSPRASTGIQSP